MTQLQREKMRAEAILDAGVGIALLELSEGSFTIRDVNDAFATLTRLDVDALLDQPSSMLTGPRTDPHVVAERL